MTPQEKAQEIYNKLVVHIQRYDEYVDDRSKFNTIKCALIAVDEMINVCYWNTTKEFLLEVKKEIENI